MFKSRSRQSHYISQDNAPIHLETKIKSAVHLIRLRVM